MLVIMLMRNENLYALALHQTLSFATCMLEFNFKKSMKWLLNIEKLMAGFLVNEF